MTAVFILIIIAALAFLFSRNISNFFYRRMEKVNSSPFSSSNFQLAQRFELKKDYDKAIIAYTHLIEEFPDFDAAYISIAEIYRVKKEYGKAIEWLNRLYNRDGSPDTLFMIAEVYMAAGETDRLEEFTKEHHRELGEYTPIIESFLKTKRTGDSEALTHLRILAGSLDAKDYIRLKAKRTLSHL